MGHRVIIAKMPSNLAVLDIKAAKRILREQDQEYWVIAGHSLGGAMACSMVGQGPGAIQSHGADGRIPGFLSGFELLEQPVLSISASEDWWSIKKL